jgi:hypothetical protein
VEEARRGAAAAAASPAEATAEVEVRFSGAPCHHPNLAALRASSKHRYTHEQLKTLPVEELAVLLNDPEFSYECPPLARARRVDGVGVVRGQCLGLVSVLYVVSFVLCNHLC